MNKREARSVYDEIVNRGKQNGAVSGEQDGSLPIATFSNGRDLGEVKIIRTEPSDYHVIWYPPEAHVGQDLLTPEATDEQDVVDVGALPPRQTVARILAFSEK